MPCFVPFNNNDLDLSFFAWRPTGVFPEELIDTLKYFSFYAEDLGCLYSSVFRSIHGSMVIWYGAWAKRSSENRKVLYNTLMCAIRHLSSLAVLMEYGFFEATLGESKDGRPLARFCTGDILSLSAMAPISADLAQDLSYACLALLKSSLMTAEGLAAGVLLHGIDKPFVATMHVWDSLAACYAWLFESSYRTTVRPYISHLSNDSEYDVFRVTYVSTDELVNVRLFAPARAIEHGADDGEGEEEGLSTSDDVRGEAK